MPIEICRNVATPPPNGTTQPAGKSLVVTIETLVNMPAIGMDDKKKLADYLEALFAPIADKALIVISIGNNDRTNARAIAAVPEVVAELRETELNLVQTRLAVGVGKKTKQQQIDFLLGQMERIAVRNAALLARIDGAQ